MTDIDLPEFNVSVKMARKTGPLHSDVEYRTFSIRTPAMDADKAREAGFGLGQGVNEATDHAWKFVDALTDDGIVVTPADDEKTDIDAIRQREQAATEGPWDTGAGEAWSDALAPWALVINANYPLVELQEGAQGVADAEFIAHARTDIPALLDLLDTAQQDIRDRYEQIARLERHIAGLETQCNEQMLDAAERDGCPVCKTEKPAVTA